LRLVRTEKNVKLALGRHGTKLNLRSKNRQSDGVNKTDSTRHGTLNST